MTNSIFNRAMAAAALSLALGLSSHATAKQCPEQVAPDGIATLTAEQVQLGAIQTLDAAQAERAITEDLMAAFEEQDMKVNMQAQNRAEAMYQRHSGSDFFATLQPGHVYQSVAIAF